MTTATTTTAHEADRYFLHRDASYLRRFLRAVDRHSARLEAWQRGVAPFPMPPTKAYKHRAYEAAYNLHLATGTPRAHDVEGLRAVLADADALLGR